MATNPKLSSKLSSPLVLLLLAALLAGGVAWLAYAYLQQREESIKNELTAKNKKKQTVMVSVVVPKVNAAINTVFNGQVFVSRAIEEDLVYPDTILAKDFESMEGQKLARPVLRGRPVRLSDLQVPEVNDVASVVPPGSRAMTIEIDNLNSIAQTLRPNHRVDIFLMSKAPKPEKGQPEVDEKTLEQASLFMQNMVILATGQQFTDTNAQSEQTAQMIRPGEVAGANTKDKTFDSITLLVSPKEAARLLVGQKMGTYRVVLRGNKDSEPLTLATLRSGDLMPGLSKKRDTSIEFISGGRGDKMVSKLPNAADLAPAARFNPPVAQAAPAELAAAVKNAAAALAGNGAAAQPIPALRSSR
jgi:pilus assembly protein CpaB